MPGPGGPGGFHRQQFLSEEEKASAPKATPELLLRILGYLKPYWLQFLAVFAAILVGSVVGLLPSIITGRIVDTALVGNDLALLVRLLFTALAAMLASQLVGVLETYINSWISERIIFDMKNEMYHHLQHMPHAFFTTEKQGDIVTRMNTDIGGVSQVISGTLTQVVSNAATVATTLVALFSMSPKLAVVGLLVLPLLIIPTRSAGRVRLKLVQESQAKNDEMNQLINETLSVSGSLLMKMFTAEDREYERFVSVNNDVTALSLRETRSGSWFRVVMGMFGQLGPLLIYFAGGYLIIRQLDPTLSVGTITATVTLVNRLYRPVENLLNLQVSFTRSLAMFARIFDYLDRVPAIVSPENGAKPDLQEATIVYDHVAFGYGDTNNPDDFVLTDVSFAVPGGQMYAIVGPSGSGKSTVVNLIPRLYDVARGSVCVAGVDVRDFDLPYLRQGVGMVTQEAYLFNGSILDNLRYAVPDATMEQIEAACRIANIHDFIVSQPKGYDTEVGNRGLKLSGGEKQRLSLARVVLKDPKILILDEATSALDSISENAIQEALEQLMVGRTSIVIAHRLSTILKADRILVVKGGVIAEQGTHEELLAANGVYRELYETQFREVIGRETGESAKGAFDVQTLSSTFEVREMGSESIPEVFALARSNRVYFRHLNERPTKANLTALITRLPEGATGGAAERTADGAAKSVADGAAKSEQHFVGFYDEDGYLVAVMSLALGWPQEHCAFVGWFMVAADMQRQGVGSQLVADLRAALEAEGYRRIELQLPERDDEGIAFWESQGYELTGERIENGKHPLVALAREI